MELLVQNLHALEETDLPDGDDSIILHAEDHPLVYVVQGIANDVLIHEDGTPRFESMDMLWNEHGFFVFPGEKDRFGWLIGCIRTKKGIIMFG